MIKSFNSHFPGAPWEKYLGGYLGKTSYKYLGKYLAKYLCKYLCKYLPMPTLASPSKPRDKDEAITSNKSLKKTIWTIDICHELYDYFYFQVFEGYQIFNIWQMLNIW